MNYTIKCHPKSYKYLERLSGEISKRIIDKLENVKKEPFRYLEHFEGEGYKLRVGDYRLLIDVDFKRRILWVRVLDKRGRIYKR